MTKYIDLLREHQQEPNTKKGAKKKKSKKNKLGSSSNPYSDKPSQDKALVEAIDDLVEESNTSSTPLTQDSESDLLIDEDSSMATVEKENIPPPIDDNGEFNTASWLQHIDNTLLSIFESVQQDILLQTSTLESQIQLLLKQLKNANRTLDTLELEMNKSLLTKHSEHGVKDLVQKSRMMMLYTIKVGLQLKIQHSDLITYTVAAMLHHISMAFVPDELRFKAKKLSKTELETIKHAPDQAITYLDKHDIQHKELRLAISQAAERYNGTGPKELSGHEVAWIARLVGLLSMFEALIHFRTYRQRLLPRDAIREIVNQYKKAFDPVMLKALIESISLYPVGTFVQINTGEIGQVINVHNKFPLRPIIHLNMDRHGNAITERKIDLKKQPNLMIQKCMYEEALEELKQEAHH